MAKITKLVFDIKGKEYVFSYDDAKELYQEMGKIFNAKPTKQQFEYDPPPVGAISRSWPLKDDQIFLDSAITATMATDTITLPNSYPDDYSWAASPPAKKYCQCS